MSILECLNGHINYLLHITKYYYMLHLDDKQRVYTPPTKPFQSIGRVLNILFVREKLDDDASKLYVVVCTDVAACPSRPEEQRSGSSASPLDCSASCPPLDQ